MIFSRRMKTMTFRAGALAFSLLMWTFLARAQSAQTSSSILEGVQDAGFSLKPAGPIELNNWTRERPLMRLNFSIGRGDKTPFRSLDAADIAVTHVNHPVAVAREDL